jgi:hypothetical protein
MIDLAANECRFPTGRPAPRTGRVRRFCGRAGRPGSPYCEAHHARAYVPRATDDTEAGDMSPEAPPTLPGGDQPEEKQGASR